MKLIIIDNFERENVSDRLVADNLTQKEAQKLLSEKQRCGDNNPDYYKIVEDDYKLYQWDLNN